MKTKFKTRMLVPALAIAVSMCGLSLTAGGVAQAASQSVYTLGEYILPAQMSNMNPFLQTGNWTPLFQYIYNQLFYFNPVSGKLQSELALRGQWSDHDQIYNVTLNPHAKWQNGTAVTAADVVYTYNVLKNPTLDPYGLWNYLKSVSGHGDVVTFTTKAPFPSLPNYLSTVYIVPAAIWERAGNPATNLNMHPIGTGPFEYVAYHTGTNIVLQKNPNSFMGDPKIDLLDILMYSNAQTVTLALQRGDIKTTEGTIAMPSLPQLMDIKTNKLQKYPGLGNFAVFMNTKAPNLSNLNVRLAIAASINQRALITQGELGGVFNGNPGWLPSTFKGDVNSEVMNSPLYGYSIARARSLLLKAGYRMSSNGIFEKNGKLLNFTYYEAAGAPAQDKEASMIQGWLKEVGIETTAKFATWPELTEIASSGQFDLVQMGITVPPDPLAAISSVFSSAATAPIGQSTPGLNYTRFTNARLDQLLSQASRTFDPSVESSLLKEAQSIIAANAPFAIMYNTGGHVVYRTNSFAGYNTNYPVSSVWSLMDVYPKA